MMIFLFQIIVAIYYLIKDNIMNDILHNTQDIPAFLILLMLGLILSFLFISLLIFYGLLQILKKGFFNLKSTQSFKIAGILIICMGLLIIAGYIYNIISAPITTSIFIPEILQKGYLILMGYGLIVIADILKNGFKLRQENDLTI